MSQGTLELDYDDPIRKYQAELKSAIDASEQLRPILKSCQDAIYRAEVKVTITVGTKRPMNAQVEILMVCKTLDELLPLFRELAKEGLKTDKSNPYTDDGCQGLVGFRVYKLGQVVVLAIMFSSEKTKGEKQCRLKQVGVREVPKYEIVCD